MKHKLASWWKTIKLTANLMAGVPDYENYVAQQRKHNPNRPRDEQAAISRLLPQTPLRRKRRTLLLAPLETNAV